MEKKTELQSLKHEEILLELESIRARRERLMPVCPNCSTQTIPVYQPMQQIGSVAQHGLAHTSAYQSHPHSTLTSPIPQQQHLLQQQSMTASTPVPILQPTPTSTLQQSTMTQSALSQHHQSQQQLLSISIPQQQATGTSVMTPLSLSPLSVQHLPQLQLIAIAGKQSVTVECQTSPTGDIVEQKDRDRDRDRDQERTELLNKFMEMTKTASAAAVAASAAVSPIPVKQQQEDESQTEPPPIIPKISSYSQTDLRTFVNKELNTDPPPIVPMRNQAVSVDLYAEQKETMPKKVTSNELFLFNILNLNRDLFQLFFSILRIKQFSQ